MSTTTEPTRVALYASFATRGRAPTVPELAHATGQSVPFVRAALVLLHASRDIVLSAAALEAFSDTTEVTDATNVAEAKGATEATDATETKDATETTQATTRILDADTDPHMVLMAHPFSSVPLGFSVMGRTTLWWGGCAWDAFALPHLLPDEAPVLVATRCPACERAMALDVGVDAPPVEQSSSEQAPGQGDAPGPVAHFLLPTTRMWDDVVHTCGHQRLFCNDACVDAWLARTGNEKGYVMSTDTLWHFARGWYKGRLEYGYQRREPGAARAYFESVGLRGRFWGLEG